MNPILEKYPRRAKKMPVSFFSRNDQAQRAPSVPIQMSRSEIFRFIRNPKNMPRFIKGLREVTEVKPGVWIWTFDDKGKSKRWQSKIIADQKDELFAWRTISTVNNGDIGAIALRDDPSGHGTVVSLKLGTHEKKPSRISGVVSKLFFRGNAKSNSFINLHRLKALLETGEVPTTEGQPSGRLIKVALKGRPL